MSDLDAAGRVQSARGAASSCGAGVILRGSAFLHGSKIGGMNIESVQGMPTFKDIYVGRQG